MAHPAYPGCNSVWRILGARKQQCRRRGACVVCASSREGAASLSALEEEFCSAERVARGLFDRYKSVGSGGYQKNLKDFARAGMTAYALGWTEEGLRREMSQRLLANQEPPSPPQQLSELDTFQGISVSPREDIEQLQSDAALTLSAPSLEDAALNLDASLEDADLTLDASLDASSLKAASLEDASGASPPNEIETLSASGTGTATKQEVEECLLSLSLVFVTLSCLPQNVVRRWSDVAPVSSDSLHQWKGFCSLIINAYYDQGMAWFSIRRLQMEQLVVMGRAETPSLVAERMRLVFTTLEVVDPRWGGLQDFPTL